MNTGHSGTTTEALSYKMLRQAVGVLGMALPFAIILGGWFFFCTSLQGSISAYYYTHMREVLVGALWVIGFFLLSYHGPDGRNSIDDWAGNFACIFAVGSTLFPTDPPDAPTNLPGGASFSALGIIALAILLTLGFFLCRFTRAHPGFKLRGFRTSRNGVGNFRAWILILCVLMMVIYRFVRSDATIALLHKGFSLLFMSMLAFFSLCLFTQTHPGHEPKGFKIKRNRVYKICGWIIVGCMVLIDIYMCVPANAVASLEKYNFVLWLETIMVLSFGVSWWVKGGGFHWLKDREA